MAENKLCAGCLRHDEEIIAESWCSECREPVCGMCAKYHRRLLPPHKTVSIQAVNKLGSEILNQSKNCPEHIKHKLTLFCCSHDQIICDVCVPESHPNCKSLISLEMAANDVNGGSALPGLIGRIENIILTLNEVLRRSDNSLSNLEKRRQEIRRTITASEREILLYLRKLEHKLLDDLEDKYIQTKSMVMKAKSDVTSKINALEIWRKDINHIEEVFTEIQIFQTLKYLDGRATDEEKYIRSLNNKITFPCLQLQRKHKTSRLEECLNLGSIAIIEKEFNLPSKIHVDRQSQVLLKENIQKPTLVSSFETTKLSRDACISRGCILPNKKIFLMNDNKLIICSYDGSNLRTIQLEQKARRVAIYKKQYVLITTADGVKVINTRTRVTETQLLVGVSCWAVASLNDTIVVCTDNKIMHWLDFNGKIMYTIQTSFDIYEITVFPAFNDGVYCSACSSDNINFITTDGKEHILYNSPELEEPSGIAVDDKGNIFVAGWASDNVLKISADGKRKDVLLTSSDNIRGPRALSYNCETHELLVVSAINGLIQIFKLV